MTVYAIDDVDGLTSAMVAAGTIAEAAAALGMSVPQMRARQWHRVKGAAAGVAMKTPGRPVYRPLGKSGGWMASRDEALARAARAILRSKAFAET